MHKSRTTVLVVAVLLMAALPVFAGGDGEAADGGPVTLRFAHFAAEDHPGHLAALQFKEAVERRTGGQITVEIFPNNQLGSPPEILEQNVLGAIDMSVATQGALGQYSQKFAVVMLPFVFRDYEHAYAVLDGPFIEWAAPDLADEGLVFLSNWEWGFRNLTNAVRPVESPADVEGLRLRTPPEVQLVAAMEALGASVQQISFSELYQALSQGVVDGQENPLPVIYFNNLYEVQNHLTLTQHVYNSMTHVMSLEIWEQLTAEQQTIIREESARAGQFMRRAVQESEEELISLLEAEGMTVVRPEDPAIFQSVMGPAYDRIAEFASEEFVDTFLEMVERF